jgi:hypothetical protein
MPFSMPSPAALRPSKQSERNLEAMEDCMKASSIQPVEDRLREASSAQFDFIAGPIRDTAHNPRRNLTGRSRQ